jgi:hypothetical protein
MPLLTHATFLLLSPHTRGRGGPESEVQRHAQFATSNVTSHVLEMLFGILFARLMRLALRIWRNGLKIYLGGFVQLESDGLPFVGFVLSDGISERHRLLVGQLHPLKNRGIAYLVLCELRIVHIL